MISIISALVSFVVLGILYKRMIKREVPESIGKAQAIVPVILGIVSLVLSTILTFGLIIVVLKLGYVAANHTLVIQSFVAAFLSAGFTEELTKMLFIFVVLALFKSKVKNVYEYVLIGAAVGFGFSLFEEFLYGGTVFAFAVRLASIAAHMVFNMIMAYYLGMAAYNKIMNKGTQIKEYVLALFIPVAIHTLYDAGTTFNKLIDSQDARNAILGVILGLITVLFMIFIQIFILVKFKKDAQKLSNLRILPKESDIQDNI